MDENRTPEGGKRQDFRRSNNANQALAFRILALAVVLYWLFDIVKGYFQGGPDAPSLTLVILSVVLLGGGAAYVAWNTWKAWKQDKAAAEMTQEEIEAMEALRKDEEDK